MLLKSSRTKPCPGQEDTVSELGDGACRPTSLLWALARQPPPPSLPVPLSRDGEMAHSLNSVISVQGAITCESENISQKLRYKHVAGGMCPCVRRPGHTQPHATVQPSSRHRSHSKLLPKPATFKPKTGRWDQT